nr:site-2 protease family protein [Arthrobacter crystallopoietes]
MPLGRIAGVPVVLAYSWFIIAAFIVITFGPQVQRAIPSLGIGAYIVAFGYAVLLLISVLVHELAHAVSARIFGWPTAKIVLNLWGGHTQFASFKATPGKSLMVALSGPAANFALAGAGILVLPLMRTSPVGYLLTDIFVWANFLVALFNILPGLPLDGGRLVESAVWRATGSQEKGTLAAGWAGRIIVVLTVLAVLGWPLLMGRQPDLQIVVIMVLVGGFLWMGASAAITNAKLRLRLPQVYAGSLKRPAVGVPATASVAQVRETLHQNPGSAVVLTAPTGQPEAIVDPVALQQVPDAGAAGTAASAAARALAPGAYVPEWAAGQELVQYLAALSGTEYAVVDQDGYVTGLLDQDAVVRAITGRNR